MSKQKDSKKAEIKPELYTVLGVVDISDYPDEAANWNWDDEWIESEKICKNCKDVKMWIAGWYDGSPDDGGACIGNQYQCGKCNNHETF